ncbi:MAG TPA: glycosyltransferase family 4 protein [Solirubrobacteraceae bacterium]|jgi:glycosyltransferase involved in cell wall biosynthesis|nr:glycosyltransferase family 4 protein [Solirubrobacteraceae bacterium]
MKPVLFVTGHAPADRLPAFAALHEREEVCFALFGGRPAHGPSTAEAQAVPAAFPTVAVSQRQVGMLAASGRFRAVLCGTGGRLALPAAYAGARAARVPFVLWASLWAHPRTPAHALSYLPLGRVYRGADAVVTYGPHVSAYVRRRGAINVFEAPQAVDNAFWGAPADPSQWPIQSDAKFVFVGRPVREKGLRVLFLAWRASGLTASAAALVLAGVGSTPPWVPAGGAVAPLQPDQAPAHDPLEHSAAAPANGAAAPVPEPAVAPVPALAVAPVPASRVAPPDEAIPPAPPGTHAVGVLPAEQLRNLYAAADVLIVPSIATRTFREPWGLVVNEAMNQRTAIVASDAVGAAAGGLVRHGRNGLVVPADDPAALADALRRLAGDAPLRERLAAAAQRDVQAFTPQAWAAGMSAALRSVGASREPRPLAGAPGALVA